MGQGEEDGTEFGKTFHLLSLFLCCWDFLTTLSALHLQSESISKTEIFMVRLVYLRSHLDPGDIEMCK